MLSTVFRAETTMNDGRVSTASSGNALSNALNGAMVFSTGKEGEKNAVEDEVY